MCTRVDKYRLVRLEHHNLTKYSIFAQNDRLRLSYERFHARFRM